MTIPPHGGVSVSLKMRLLAMAGSMGFCLGLWWFGLIPNLIPTRAFLLVSGALTAIVSLLFPSRAARIGASGLIACGCLLAGDLLWRLKPPPVFSYRPEELFLNHWPPMPALGRFRPDAYFDAVTYGELAAMSGRLEYREYRHLRFRSDHFGFPNESIPEQANVILLGDSFGAGSATSQDKTWASLLHSHYAAAVYNLSMPDCGPWQELMNLKLELPRVKHTRDTTVVWAIFSGNDLDDQYQDRLEPATTNNGMAEALVSLASFRNRSPVLRIFGQALLVAQGGRHPPVLRRLATGRTIMFRPGYITTMQRTLQEIESHPNYHPLIRVFGEMSRFATREGLRVAVVMVPSKEEVYRWILMGDGNSHLDSEPSAFATVVHRLSDVNGFEFADLKPPMIAEARTLFAGNGELLWWTDDTHWNERGHALAASLVYDRFLRRTQLARAQ